MANDAIIVDTGLYVADEKHLHEPAPYFARAYRTPSKPGCWDVNRVEVVERATNRVLGEYNYNYSSIARTFHPFFLRGRWYALYSKNYTASRLMRLPECQDIGGEEPNSFGFCPVDFYVPTLYWIESTHKESCPRHASANDGSKPCSCGEDAMVWRFPERLHGFVAGCVWGDDSSWKIQYLDLSRADQGKLVREARFGYIELPSRLNLDAAIEIDDAEEADEAMLKIATASYYHLRSGRKQE